MMTRNARHWALAAALSLGAVNAAAAQTDMGMIAPAGRLGIESQDIRAQLLPSRFTTLSAEIGAKIIRLPVEEGGRFTAGETLVAFDCALPEAMLQKAEAELESAERVLAANRRLAELQSIGVIEIEQTATAVAKSTAELRAKQVVVSKCTVLAPFGGRIAEQLVREQQYVQPGQALLDILDDSTLELNFLVPSRWLAWLAIGQNFEVAIDETMKTYPARLMRIGARVDPVSQSIKVAAAIDGSFPELIAGMSGTIHMTRP